MWTYFVIPDQVWFSVVFGEHVVKELPISNTLNAFPSLPENDWPFHVLLELSGNSSAASNIAWVWSPAYDDILKSGRFKWRKKASHLEAL